MDKLKLIPVLQIVGYKNSGKTSIIRQLVESLNLQKYKIGVVKHHGHGGKPDFDEKPETDTAQIGRAGAYVTSIEGEGFLHMHVRGNEQITLQQILDMYQTLPLDLILVEGYKMAHYPKMVTVKSIDEIDDHFHTCSNVVGLFISRHTTLEKQYEIPVFRKESLSDCEQFILDHFIHGVES